MSTRLRQWQQAAFDAYAAADFPRDWLVVATPGAGKTTFALRCARHLLDRRIVTQVVVVCPTDHLRHQWAVAATGAGVPLATAPPRRGAVARTSDYDGYITTYAQIATDPPAHRRRVGGLHTLLIVDEIHHAGDALSWGRAISVVGEVAVQRLALTGTPWRTSDTETIPFVRYEPVGGELTSQADYTFSYRDGLRAGVVRPVMFAAYGGSARWKVDDEEKSYTLSEDLSKQQEMDTWRRLLDPKGDWIGEVIAAAHDRLLALRRDGGMPDAAGMVLAGDQESARAYVPIVHRITGQRPTLVLSDDRASSKKIDTFRGSGDYWCIAVRQISEGVDVPRLAVGVWATSYRTPLFFAQAVGRFVRARRRGEIATVFLPAVRPLLALAAEVDAAREHVLAGRDQHDDEPTSDDEPRDAADAPTSEAQLLDAQASFESVLAGRTVTRGRGDDLTVEDEEYIGLLGGVLSPQQTAVLLRKRDEQRAAERRRAPRPAVEDEPVDDQHSRHVYADAMQVRRSTNAAVAKLARITGEPHGALHARLQNAVRGPAQAEASIDVLQKRSALVLQWLRAAQPHR